MPLEGLPGKSVEKSSICFCSLDNVPTCNNTALDTTLGRCPEKHPFDFLVVTENFQ